ncbi:MAG: exodeoxyribonuclease VII small subunit [Propionibacteriaceae bacterium]|nr:exodeoxyribonuclease VII small subunit [Propionibacteriaceae bacterium]
MTTPPAPGRTPPDDIAQMSYEQARDALIDTVAKLESGQADLETSVGLWERGEALAAHCTAALDRAEARLDRRAAHTSGDPEQTAADESDESAATQDDPEDPHVDDA